MCDWQMVQARNKKEGYCKRERERELEESHIGVAVMSPDAAR